MSRNYECDFTHLHHTCRHITRFCLAGAALAISTSAQAMHTGFYVGGSVAHTAMNVKVSDNPLETSLTRNGVTGNLLAGYHWVMNRFVLGVEANIRSESGKIPNVDADGDGGSEHAVCIRC